MNLGTVTIEYNENGKAKSAIFLPEMEIKLGKEALQGLLSTTGAVDQEQLKRNSDIVFAEWFNKINEVELADRNEYELRSRVLLCQRWPNGNVQTCRIGYSFEPK